jgi:hypothetical protein
VCDWRLFLYPEFDLSRLLNLAELANGNKKGRVAGDRAGTRVSVDE